jgi:hypothetical protein
MTVNGCVRRGTAVATAWVLALTPLAPLARAQQPTPPPTPAAAPGAPDTVDGGWPRDYTTASGGALRMFPPQVASWDGQRHIVLYAAVAFSAKDAAKPAMGTVKVEADSRVALDDRLVSFSTVKLSEVNFPGLPNEQLREIVTRIEQLVPEGNLVMALDRVLARLDKSQIIPKNVDQVKGDPPLIFHSTSPAILVNVDGEPVWSPIKDNDLKFAVNTNWDLFEHGPTRALFLRHDSSWLTATQLHGPWKPAGKLPESFARIPADDNWKDVKAAVPGRTLSAASVPRVFVSTTPAELILLQGAPQYLVVSGTKLLWVSNTETDLFRMGREGPVYFLASGRWFSAPSFEGPWTFATPSLPDDFKKISLEHPRSRVLASVPGTDQAIEAILLAQIPQTARVNKKEIKAPEVQYQGEPQFQPIEATTVARATNTDKDVIKVGDLYYMCFQGIWFMARSPNGPWEAAETVPREIYEIPASSPAHHVTYVTVVEDDDDEWVTYAAVAGYTGMMVAWGCAVWGTGWYYPPYVYYGGFYPYYRPYYPSYGYYASYNPWTGSYSRGAVAYGPYGGAGIGARYNPRTGTYARGAAAWGPYGGRGVAEAYNPRTGTYGATRQGSNVYGSWGQTAVQRGDQWATTSRVTNQRTGTTTRATQGSGGGGAVTRTGPQGSGGVARTASGDVYAGRDGNVYRKQGDSWQKYDGGSGSWGNVEQPTPQQREQAQQRATQAQGQGQARDRAATTDAATVGQLNRDSAARAEGAQRTRDYSTSGRSTGSGSYRPSSGARAGGARAGGGRRR